MTRQTNAYYQRAYRERQAALRDQLRVRTEALEAIVAHPKTPAVVRDIAARALKGE